MDFGIGTYIVGYLAGALSILSPCVLPLVPIVLGTALTAHRWGALALTAGLALSFSSVGIAVTIFGASLGLGAQLFRQAAAVLLIVFGVTLLSTSLQTRFATATAGISSAGNMLLADMQLSGLAGQFVLGVLLGIVWSPCVGPTLGAAMTLASQGEDLVLAALLMAVFGLGAGTPMLILGSLSRTTMLKFRGKIQNAGRFGKYALGILLVILGATILVGVDKNLEELMLEMAPAWIIDFSTRF